MEQAVSM